MTGCAHNRVIVNDTFEPTAACADCGSELVKVAGNWIGRDDWSSMAWAHFDDIDQVRSVREEPLGWLEWAAVLLAVIMLCAVMAMLWR